MRLLLIRHGQTPSNVRGELETSVPGPGLTPLGERQAAEIPAALQNDPIDLIAVSILLRTQLTAQPLALARRVAADICPGLHEIEAGDLEGRTDKDAHLAYLEASFAWSAGELDRRMPGGPDGHDFFDRYDADIAQIAASGAGTAVVVSHGAAIRVWAGLRATNIDHAFAADHPLDNTGIVELIGSTDDGWTVASWAGAPIGGPEVTDAAADDPTGESLGEARETSF